MTLTTGAYIHFRRATLNELRFGCCEARTDYGIVISVKCMESCLTCTGLAFARLRGGIGQKLHAVRLDLLLHDGV